MPFIIILKTVHKLELDIRNNWIVDKNENYFKNVSTINYGLKKVSKLKNFCVRVNLFFLKFLICSKFLIYV